MSEAVLIVLPFVLLFLLLAYGVPVAFSLGISGFVSLAIGFGLPTALGYVQVTPYRQAAHYTMGALPLFLLMGYIASRSRMTNGLFDAAYAWVGHLRGGLAHATIIAGAIFAACSGSSIASAAVLAPVVMPQMERFKYDKKLALGTIAAAGTLAVMIPPSLVFIAYSLLTEVSVGKLFIAGIVPGILSAIMFMISVYIRVKMNPSLAPPAQSFTLREKVTSLWEVIPIGILVFIVLGGIYLGVMTPTESGAVGACGGIVIGFVKRQLNMKGVMESMIETVRATAMIFFVIIGAFIFGYAMTLAQVPDVLVAFFSGLPFGRWVVMGLILIVYLFLGCLMDTLAMICITVPIVFPVIVALGFDPVWFGIILTKTVELGLVTPPVGLNVYVIQAATKEPLTKVFAGCFPFVYTDLITLLLLVAFPQISLFLVGMMN